MDNRKIFCVIFLIFEILLISQNVAGWKHFWRGRHFGKTFPEGVLQAYSLPKEQWFDQLFDHFQPTNSETWKQRYFVNSKYYKPGGPVFLMVGGEGEIEAEWMEKGAWIHYAKDLNALCFQVEHRYYGKSHPTSDLSLKNLMFLSSELALADLSYFITSMNKEYNLTQNTKWIAFGGSYPGSLAAWLREKYPHLVHGAISSSGPLLAKVDFKEYYEVVTKSLATHSDNCVEAVQKGIEQVNVLLKHMIGQKNLDKKFKLCDPIEESVLAKNNLDIANFFNSLAENFAGVVQYNNDNSHHAKINIDEICDVMVNETVGTPVDRLAKVNELILKSENEECLDYKYDKMIKELQETSWDSKTANGERQWIYQTCSEFGFYQTSEGENSLFGNHFAVDFFIKQCGDIYSEKFNKDTLDKIARRTNILYGGLNIETTNVLYVHGSIDPWHALGLTSSNNTNEPVIFIKGTAHCANMYEPRDKDIPELTDARSKIKRFIENLLKQ